MFAIGKNAASDLTRPQRISVVVAWIAESGAKEIYLAIVSNAELLQGPQPYRSANGNRDGSHYDPLT